MSNVMFDRMWAQDRIAKAKETIKEYQSHLNRADVSEEDRDWLKAQIESRTKDLGFLKHELGKTLY